MAVSDGLVSKVENFVVASFRNVDHNLSVAHDFKHVDRARKWALILADEEGYPDIGVVEITALLHDIGLAFVNNDDVAKGYIVLPPHGPLGADIATKYLRENSILSPELIDQIAGAIRHHSDPPIAAEELIAELGEKGILLAILRDADTLDALGAVGVMRALTSKAFLPEYDPEEIKGNAWDLTPEEFKAKFGFESKRGLSVVETIVDQVNQQIRYRENFLTGSGAKYADALLPYMKQFVLQLEAEITHSEN